MTFYEEIVTSETEYIYSRIAYFHKGFTHKWYVNDERDVFCVCRGKRGPETPHFYNMIYKGYRVKFCAYWEGDCYVTGPEPDWMKEVCYYIEDDMSIDEKDEMIDAVKALLSSDVLLWGRHDIDALNFIEKKRSTLFE